MKKREKFDKVMPIDKLNSIKKGVLIFDLY